MGSSCPSGVPPVTYRAVARISYRTFDHDIVQILVDSEYLTGIFAPFFMDVNVLVQYLQLVNVERITDLGIVELGGYTGQSFSNGSLAFPFQFPAQIGSR